jgi:folate-binding protein YgfZ
MMDPINKGITADSQETPLRKTHEKGGAEMAVWFGCALPDHFSDWLTDYQNLCESVGVVDKNYRAYLRFTGPDRVRYLNAILTNDIKGLTPNHANISLFLNPQGHIQAEIETQARANELFCVSDAMIRDRLVPALDKYIIMDDVTLTDETTAHGTLALEGPKAAVVVEELCGVRLGELGDLQSHEVSLRGIPGRIERRTTASNMGAEFLFSRESLAEAWKTLVEAAQAHGGSAAGYAALNALRLEQGIAWFGYDFGEKQIPHEAGLENSHISYTKGCYTGQEIVERVRSRGQVNRVRVSLRFENGEPPAANVPLLSEGKELGYVTRAAFSPKLNSAIGMGYLRREKSVAGTVLECGNTKATVIATPLV